MNEIPLYYNLWGYNPNNSPKWSPWDVEVSQLHYPLNKTIVVHNWEEFLQKIEFIKTTSSETIPYRILFSNVNYSSQYVSKYSVNPIDDPYICYSFQEIKNYLNLKYEGNFNEDDFILFEKVDESKGLYKIKNINGEYTYLQYNITDFYKDFQNIEQDSIEIPCSVDFNGFTLKNLKFKENCGFLISNEKMISNLICLNLQVEENNKNGIFLHTKNMQNYPSMFHEAAPTIDHCYLDININNIQNNFTLINYPTNDTPLHLSNSIINLNGIIPGDFYIAPDTNNNYTKAIFYHNIINFNLEIQGNWIARYYGVIINCCELNGNLTINGGNNIYDNISSCISNLNISESTPNLIGLYDTNVYNTNYNPNNENSNLYESDLIDIPKLFNEHFPVAEKTISKNNSKKENLIGPLITQSGIDPLKEYNETFSDNDSYDNVYRSYTKYPGSKRSIAYYQRSVRYGDMAQTFYTNEKWFRDYIIDANENIIDEGLIFNKSSLTSTPGKTDIPNFSKDYCQLTGDYETHWGNHWPFMQSIKYNKKYIFTFFMRKERTDLNYVNTFIIPELYTRSYSYVGSGSNPYYNENHRGITSANNSIFSLQSSESQNAIPSYGALDENSSLTFKKVIRDDNTNGYSIFEINCPADGKFHGFYFAFELKDLESLGVSLNTPNYPIPTFVYPALYFIPGPAYEDEQFPVSNAKSNEQFTNFMLKEGDINDPENIDFTYSYNDRRMQFTVEDDKLISSTRVLLGYTDSPEPPGPEPPGPGPGPEPPVPSHKRPVYYTVPNQNNPFIIEKIIKIYDYYDTFNGIGEDAKKRKYDYLPPQT